MKNFLRLGFTTVALMFLFNGFAVTETNAQNPVAEALKRMDENNKRLKTLKANIVTEKYNSQLEEKDTREGKLHYVPQPKGNPYVRLDWTKPLEESLYVVGKQYVLYRKRSNEAFTGNIDEAKGNENASGALAYMNMSKAELQASYTIRYVGQEKVSGGTETWHLELTPKNKSKYKAADIWINKDGMPIVAKLTEKNDDTTTIFLSGIETNITIAGSIFKFNPKGVRIVPS